MKKSTGLLTMMGLALAAQGMGPDLDIPNTGTKYANWVKSELTSKQKKARKKSKAARKARKINYQKR